jgi:hypothetical protein
MTTAI